MLSENNQLAGGNSIHLGETPLKNHPKSRSKRGFHYTTDNSLRDVWHWKAVRVSEMSYLDDNHFAAPSSPCQACPRYKAGYRTDPQDSGANRNNWAWFYPDNIVPLRLPKLPQLKQDIINNQYIAPSLSWYQTEPYTQQRDDYPIGTRLPSVLSYEDFEGDRANVQAKGRWHEGYWYLELSRNLEKNSTYDLTIKDGLYLWFTTFDHAQSRHSYHLSPIKVMLEEE